MRTEAARAADGYGQQLLHNMSCRPSATVRHEAPRERIYGRGKIFCVPGDDGERSSARTWLKMLSGRPCRLSVVRAEAELRRRLDKHVRTLDLPPAAVVQDTSCPGDSECTDLITILTVVSKSAGNVFLREKVPNLSNLTAGRRVVLIVPPSRRFK